MVTRLVFSLALLLAVLAAWWDTASTSHADTPSSTPTPTRSVIVVTRVSTPAMPSPLPKLTPTPSATPTPWPGVPAVTPGVCPWETCPRRVWYLPIATR